MTCCRFPTNNICTICILICDFCTGSTLIGPHTKTLNSSISTTKNSLGLLQKPLSHKPSSSTRFSFSISSPNSLRWGEERLWFERLRIWLTGKWLSQNEEKGWRRKLKNYPFFVMHKLDWFCSLPLISFINMQAPGTSDPIISYVSTFVFAGSFHLVHWLFQIYALSRRNYFYWTWGNNHWKETFA